MTRVRSVCSSSRIAITELPYRTHHPSTRRRGRHRDARLRPTITLGPQQAVDIALRCRAAGRPGRPEQTRACGGASVRGCEWRDGLASVEVPGNRAARAGHRQQCQGQSRRSRSSKGARRVAGAAGGDAALSRVLRAGCRHRRLAGGACSMAARRSMPRSRSSDGSNPTGSMTGAMRSRAAFRIRSARGPLARAEHQPVFRVLRRLTPAR